MSRRMKSAAAVLLALLLLCGAALAEASVPAAAGEDAPPLPRKHPMSKQKAHPGPGAPFIKKTI